MSKRILAAALVLAVVVMLAACSSRAPKDQAPAAEPSAPEQTEEVKEPEAPAKTEKTVDAIADALGLTDKTEVMFSIVGAQDGAEFNGGDVEVYIYEDQNADGYKGFASGSGMFGTAYCRDGVVLVFLDGVEPDTKIVEAFEGLTF